MSGPAGLLVSIFVTLAAPAPVTAPDPTAMASRVRALLVEGRWVEALDEARRSVRETPESPDLRAVLGEALYRAGRITEAGGAVEGLMTATAPPARALLVLGLVRMAEGRHAEAADLLMKAVAADPEDRVTLYWAAGGATSRAEAI